LRSEAPPERLPATALFAPALRVRWATARLWRKRAICLWARALSATRPSFFLFFDVVAEVAANELVTSTNVAMMRNMLLNLDVISGSLKNLLPRVSFWSHCKFPALRAVAELVMQKLYLVVSGTGRGLKPMLREPLHCVQSSIHLNTEVSNPSASVKSMRLLWAGLHQISQGSESSAISALFRT
jgi:hypothetical protein